MNATHPISELFLKNYKIAIEKIITSLERFFLRNALGNDASVARCEKTKLFLPYSPLPLQQLDPAAPLTVRWVHFISFVSPLVGPGLQADGSCSP
jgi:hypothetical protein